MCEVVWTMAIKPIHTFVQVDTLGSNLLILNKNGRNRHNRWKKKGSMWLFCLWNHCLFFKNNFLSKPLFYKRILNCERDRSNASNEQIWNMVSAHSSGFWEKTAIKLSPFLLICCDLKGRAWCRWNFDILKERFLLSSILPFFFF